MQVTARSKFYGQAERAISTGKLMHYCTSTSSLSTWWSSRALLFPFGLGDLILERASRLYAFSGYHNRTSLPSRAIGMTTGTQEVRPSRSSRTKDSPLQISYAHSR